MKIHTGDTVLVITGKDKGKTGTVLRILHDRNRVIVQGLNMRVKHIKKTLQSAGQKIKYEASLHASNVMLVDPKTKKPTRVGHKVDEKTGKKVRIALVSGAVIEKAAPVKAAKPKAEKKDDKKKESKSKEAKETAAPAEAVKPGAKSPFWKRMGFGSQAMAEEGGGAEKTEAPEADSHPTKTVQRRSRGS